MILLRKIQLTDFLSHKATTLTFSENEKALIDGASGAGKSSIFDAIIWVLYGISRADNRSLIRKGAKRGSVCLELKTDTEVIWITRTVTSAGKHTLDIATVQPNGARTAIPLSGIRELQNYIDKDLIGASYILFVNSVAYVQGGAESFVGQTAPKRKELLLEIVKAEDYTKYYEKARQTLSELQNEQSMASGQIVELEARFAFLDAGIGARNTHVGAIGRNTELLLEIEPKIKILQEKKASFLTATTNIDNVDSLLKSAIQEATSTELDISRKSSKIINKKALVDKLSTAPDLVIKLDASKRNLEEIRNNLQSASLIEKQRNDFYATKPAIDDWNFQKVQRAEAEIKKIEEKPVCPSGEKCPYSGDHTGAIKKLQEEIVSLKDTMNQEAKKLADWTIASYSLPLSPDLKQIMADMKKSEDVIRKLESELGGLESIQKDLSTIEEIEKELPELEKLLVTKKESVVNIKRQKELAEASIDKAEVQRVNEELVTHEWNRDNYKASITRAKVALENIEKDEKELKEVGAKISFIRNEKLKSIEIKTKKVEMVKQAFGPKGIETLVIDYLLPKLEDKVNEVLSKLSDFRVHLDTQKKGTDGESIVEGLFITILNEAGEEMPFEAYSGGEKLKISVAISEALASLQKVGFRLFDETFIGLDENSTESFAQVLESLQQNFSQVLCISHLLQIKELFDKKIQIIKNNNISYVNQ